MVRYAQAGKEREQREFLNLPSLTLLTRQYRGRRRHDPIPWPGDNSVWWRRQGPARVSERSV